MLTFRDQQFTEEEAMKGLRYPKDEPCVKIEVFFRPTPRQGRRFEYEVSELVNYPRMNRYEFLFGDRADSFDEAYQSAIKWLKDNGYRTEM